MNQNNIHHHQVSSSSFSTRSRVPAGVSLRNEMVPVFLGKRVQNNENGSTGLVVAETGTGFNPDVINLVVLLSDGETRVKVTVSSAPEKGTKGIYKKVGKSGFLRILDF